jgi:hypothetical protein
MPTIEELQSEIDQLKARNKKVEADKAWETSKTRKGLILVLTYCVMVLFFWSSGIGNAFINAIVPSIGFFLSTLSISVVKKEWMKIR